MSLYSHGFALLPRPARSVLSVGHESTRAQLPDFGDVEELRTFVSRLFLYRLAVPGFYIQLKVGASVICLLIVVVLATISRRMYDKSFWVVRIMKKPSGSVIVPNAMLCFSMIEGVFGAVFVAFCWSMCQIYEARRFTPDNLPLWILLPWCPLIVGATWAAWGTFFATPSKTNISSYAIEQRPNTVQRIFNHAVTINSLGLFIPFLICVSVVIPAVLSTIRFNDAQRQQDVWLTTYATQTEFTQQMVQDAQAIWYRLLSAMRIVSATYIVWVFWALLMCIAYSWIAVRLILSIRRELRKSRTTGPRYGVVATTRIMSSHEDGNAAQNDVENDGQDVQFQHRLAAQPSLLEPSETPVMTDFRALRKASAASAKTAVNTGRMNEFDADEDGVFKAIAHFADDDAEHAEKRANLSPPSPPYAHEADDAVEPRKTIIPNIIMRNRTSVSTATVSRDNQVKELRKAFVHICIQFFAVSPACISFMAIALLLAVTSYGGTEQPWQGGILFERMLAIALIAVVWITCLFGGITLVAIAQRTYEPVFSNLHFNNNLSGSLHQSSSGGRNRSNTANVSSPRSPRSTQRRSLMLVSNFLSGGAGKRPSHRGGRTENRHAMSTFFETHTRTNAPSDGNRHGAGHDRFSPRNGQPTHQRHERDADVARSAATKQTSDIGTYDDHDDREELHEYDRASMDIARRGLFIERTTVVRVEEEGSDYHDASTPSSTVFAPNEQPSSQNAQRYSVQDHFSSPRNPDARQRHDNDDDSIIDTVNSHNLRGVQSRLSDDDDAYFHGGTGRRSRNSRQGRQNATFAIGYAQ